jgi:hypothetical protein
MKQARGKLRDRMIVEDFFKETVSLDEFLEVFCVINQYFFYMSAKGIKHNIWLSCRGKIELLGSVKKTTLSNSKIPS